MRNSNPNSFVLIKWINRKRNKVFNCHPSKFDKREMKKKKKMEKNTRQIEEKMNKEQKVRIIEKLFKETCNCSNNNDITTKKIGDNYPNV